MLYTYRPYSQTTSTYLHTDAILMANIYWYTNMNIVIHIFIRLDSCHFHCFYNSIDHNFSSIICHIHQCSYCNLSESNLMYKGHKLNFFFHFNYVRVYFVNTLNKYRDIIVKSTLWYVFCISLSTNLSHRCYH